MRKKAFLILSIIFIFIARPAFSQSDDQDSFGKRLKCSHYAGAAAMLPKDKDFDLGAGLIYGVQWYDGKEGFFLDLTLADTQSTKPILWFAGDTRHTIVRFGYKKAITRNRKLLIGGNIQTQHMDFGSRQITGTSLGAIIEYKATRNWSVQLESVQKTKHSGIYFGNFTLYLVKNL